MADQELDNEEDEEFDVAHAAEPQPNALQRLTAYLTKPFGKASADSEAMSAIMSSRMRLEHLVGRTESHNEANGKFEPVTDEEESKTKEASFLGGP